MLQLYPVYLLCNRHKTLTGSPDPTHANGTNKPCSCLRVKPDDSFLFLLQKVCLPALQATIRSTYVTLRNEPEEFIILRKQNMQVRWSTLCRNHCRYCLKSETGLPMARHKELISLKNVFMSKKAFLDFVVTLFFNTLIKSPKA